MQSNTNKQLHAVYNGSEIITASGFTMQSNYVVPVLARMVNEGLILQSGMDVIQAILSFKHTEENPYPTRETIALYLGKGIDYVKKALKTIKNSGIIAIQKIGRKSTYNFKPFFALLEKFIVEFKQKKNHKVKIADLINVEVQQNPEQDFTWTEEYKEEKEVEQVQEVVLPETIQKVLEVNGVTEEGISAVEKAYNDFSDKLSDEVFVEKALASTGKKNFVKYFNTCIQTAYVKGEQPKEQVKNNAAKKIIRTEQLPQWVNEEKTVSETIDIATANAEELAKEEAEVHAMLEMIPTNKPALEKLELIAKRKEQLNLNIKEEGVL